MDNKTRDIGYAMPTSHIAEVLGVLGEGCWFYHTRGGNGKHDWVDNDDWVGPFTKASEAVEASAKALPQFALYSPCAEWLQEQLDREEEGYLLPPRPRKNPPFGIMASGIPGCSRTGG